MGLLSAGKVAAKLQTDVRPRGWQLRRHPANLSRLPALRGKPMRHEDAVRITGEGISYSRGVHIVQRRPELILLTVNSQGAIVHECRFPTGPFDSESATPRVVALIETAELVGEIQ